VLDDIFVPDGAGCVLDRTRANGSIVVGDGVTLVATSVVITGKLQADGAADVRVGGASTFGGVSLLDKRIKGSLQCKENIPAPTGRGNRAASQEDRCARL
jgi:hypothetical protein